MRLHKEWTENPIENDSNTTGETWTENDDVPFTIFEVNGIEGLIDALPEAIVVVNRTFTQDNEAFFFFSAAPAATVSIAWHAFFEAEANELEAWSVAADATFPEIVPALQLTVEGQIINDKGTTKTGPIDANNFGANDGLPETIEHSIPAGTELWFYVELSNLDATQVTWTIETDTNEPDVENAPTGEKWIVLYKVEAVTDTYTIRWIKPIRDKVYY